MGRRYFGPYRSKAALAALNSQNPKPRKDLKRTLRRIAHNRVGKNVTHGRINPMAMLRIPRTAKDFAEMGRRPA